MRLPLLKNLRTWSAITAVIGLTACAAIVGLEDGNSANVSVAYDAGPDRTPPPPPPPIPKCRNAGLPPKPLSSPNVRGILPVLVTAATDVRVSDPRPEVGQSGQSGYDLDGVCTCTDDEASRISGEPSCVASGKPELQCDYVPRDGGAIEGIDNNLYQVFASLPLPDLSDAVNFRCVVGRGSGTILYTLSDYNGELNDDSVYLSFVNPRRFKNSPQEPTRGSYVGQRAGCVRFTNLDSDGGPLRCGAADTVAELAGCDEWFFPKDRTGNVTSPGLSGFQGVRLGYVTEGKLVVKYDDPTNISLGTIVVSATDTWVTADIELLDDTGRHVDFGSESVKAARTTINAVQNTQNGSNIRMRLRNGLQGGRISANELYRASGRIAVSNEARSACEIALYRGLFTEVQKTICNLRDVTSAAARDLKGNQCDSLSYALKFEAEPAYYGEGRDMPDDTLGECYLKNPDGGVVPDSALGNLNCEQR
jgi:hypothetical protein